MKACKTIPSELKSFNLGELARLTNTKLIGNPSHTISGIETLEGASDSDASFLSNLLYSKFLKTTRAGVVFIKETVSLLPNKNYLVSHDPSVAFQQVIDLLFPEEKQKSGFLGIHPTAVIHETAQIGMRTTIGPYAVIEKGVVIGEDTTISSHVFIGSKTFVGHHSLIYPHVTIREHCMVGNRVVIQSGVVIGSCGFGYATNEEGKHIPLRQIGWVEIEDDVEIGANTTIDRGRFKKTVVKRGTKIDNLVQIAHQVEIGEDNLIVAQVGIAGSTKTGKNCVLAGQVGLVGHVKLGDGVILAARTAVIHDLPERGIFSGVPAAPIREYNEQLIHTRNLKKYVKRIRELEKRLEEIERMKCPNKWIVPLLLVCGKLMGGTCGVNGACSDLPIMRVDTVVEVINDDEFLSGYVQSLVDMNYYEFQVKVIVKSRFAYVFGLPNNALVSNSILCFIAGLPQVCGVQEVECSPEEFFGCKQVYAKKSPYCQAKGIWFPQNTVIFQPFIADPRQVTNSAALRFNDNVIGKHVGAVSFGDIFPFYRWLDLFKWQGDLEIGLEGGIFAVFDLDNVEECLVNTDFFVALRLAYACDKWSYRFRWWHMSSHLGDEYLLGNPDIVRRNVSDEGVDLFASYQIVRMIRIYGGVGYIYSRDEEFPEHPLYIEYGTEVKVFGCRDFFNKLHIQPFLAMHFRNWEEHSFELDGTYAIGLEWGKIQGVGRKLRIFGEYHEGHCREGQFVRRRSSYAAIRLTYGF